jgi:hypothetical protein
MAKSTDGAKAAGPARIRAAMTVLALIPVLAGFPGCQSRAKGRAAVMDRGELAEAAGWRRRYRMNRPEAPRDFRVFPVPPRDNSFKEFDASAFQGLDAQPELPELPSDRPGVPHLQVPTHAAVPAAGRLSAPPPGGRGKAPAAPAVPPPPRPLPGPGGVNAGTHFYPVEQLVYGGDYPDIDKPELYRLMPRDVVTIAVKDHPEFSGEQEIQADGTVRLPNTADLIRLRGLTVDEAAAAAREAAAVYVKGPCLVRVQANRARGGYYFVFGEVLQPGRFPMGLEPVKLSEAVLAANWEANPSRRDLDGEELGPSFPAASPRGRYTAPPLADLARVGLITPHRSRPVRSTHDVRSALLGVTGDDPLVRPGQIIVVPSLDPSRNLDLGAESRALPTIPAPARENGLSYSASPARPPEAPLPPRRQAPATAKQTAREAPDAAGVDENMAAAFAVGDNAVPPSGEDDWPKNYLPPGVRLSRPGASGAGNRGWRLGF